MKNDKEIYMTNIFTKFVQININFSNNSEAMLLVDFIKRVDD